MEKIRILGFIPAYNCENQLPRVLKQIDKSWVRDNFEKFVIVENVSTDSTLTCAIIESKNREGFLEVYKNQENYGLGGSHKVAMKIAKSKDCDWLLVFHGDDQGNLEDFRELIESRRFENFDAVLGARFTKKSARQGYSNFRTVGNYIFNFFYSIFLKRKITDMGSGLNMYRVKAMEQSSINAPDGLIYPPYLLTGLVLNKFSTYLHPICWKETDQVSNAKLLRQSFDTFKLGFLAFVLGKKYLEIEFQMKDFTYESVKVSS